MPKPRDGSTLREAEPQKTMLVLQKSKDQELTVLVLAVFRALLYEHARCPVEMYLFSRLYCAQVDGKLKPVSLFYSLAFTHHCQLLVQKRREYLHWGTAGEKPEAQLASLWLSAGTVRWSYFTRLMAHTCHFLLYCTPYVHLYRVWIFWQFLYLRH